MKATIFIVLFVVTVVLTGLPEGPTGILNPAGWIIGAIVGGIGILVYNFIQGRKSA